MIRTNRLEDRGAEGRGERQREEGREQDRYGHRHGELAIDGANRAAGKCHRNEHGRQNQRDTNDSTGNFVHRLARGFLGGKPFFGHDTFDVFDHHDGVIDDDTNRQNHAEHGQHVDGKPCHIHDGKGAEQGDWGDDGRDQRIADLVEEDEHHEENEDHCLDQRGDHFFNRYTDKRRGIVWYGPAHPVGHGLGQFGHSIIDGGRGFERVGAGGKLDTQRGYRFP